MSITISDCYHEQDFLDHVRINGLLNYNVEKTGGKIRKPELEITKVALNEKGQIVGGVGGDTYFSSLEVTVLWVKEEYRGQHVASQLLNEIEHEARQAGCQLSHLTTYSFQAPLFYQKKGYVICGEIDGFPDNAKLFVLKKQL